MYPTSSSSSAASAFPQNIGYNPTGLLAGLAYFSAAAIRDSYLVNRQDRLFRHEELENDWVKSSSSAAPPDFGCRRDIEPAGPCAAGEKSLAASEASSSLIARGEYLFAPGSAIARLATQSPDVRPLRAGCGKWGTLIGAIYTTNITPDPTYGIGGFTLTDFDSRVAFRRFQGSHALSSLMPYPSYSNTTPEDVVALYAYFKSGVTPFGHSRNIANEIPFPLSMRWPLTFWQGCCFRRGRRCSSQALSIRSRRVEPTSSTVSDIAASATRRVL